MPMKYLQFIRTNSASITLMRKKCIEMDTIHLYEVSTASTIRNRFIENHDQSHRRIPGPAGTSLRFKLYSPSINQTQMNSSYYL